MAKMSLNAMSVEDLLRLRDDVNRLLSRKANELHEQLAALGEDVSGRGRRGGRVSAMKGRKVPAKYRGPGGESWAGRGARPRWLAALLKEGHKLDEFAIERAPPARKRVAAKKSRRKKK